MAATIETLGIAERWRDAKTEEERAGVLAPSLRELEQRQLAQLATKSDLEALRAATKADPTLLHAELREDLARLEGRLEARIEAVQANILKWLAMLFVALAGVIIAAIRLL